MLERLKRFQAVIGYFSPFKTITDHFRCSWNYLRPCQDLLKRFQAILRPHETISGPLEEISGHLGHFEQHKILFSHKTSILTHFSLSLLPFAGKSQAINPKRHVESIARFCRAHRRQHVQLWCRRRLAGTNRRFCRMVPHKLLTASAKCNQSIGSQWKRCCHKSSGQITK